MQGASLHRRTDPIKIDKETGVNSSSRAIGETLPRKTTLNREQIIGFWAAWSGWTLDGMDSVIFALVLVPALKELLPLSGFAATPGVIGLAGSLMFALFLVGWGFSYIWGPLADRFGRVRVLAATTLFYAVFTGLAAISHNVWELAIFRFLAGVGVGGEWALAGTYVAEAWPEDRRRVITRDFSSPRRSTTPSARTMAGVSCSCAACCPSWSRFIRCSRSANRANGNARMGTHPLRRQANGLYAISSRSLIGNEPSLIQCW
jgi:hypothetical protein